MRDKKYMTKADFIRLNDKAIERDFNRSVYPSFYDEVLEDGVNYPIGMAILHNPDAPDGGEMRVSLSYPKSSSRLSEARMKYYHIEMDSVTIDMTPEDYESLPSVEEYLS